MLEETKTEYKITSINLGKEEQFKPEFLKINPYCKIPAIIDHEKDLVLTESGAILIYLAKKSGQFLPKENEIRIFEWLMFQMGNVGPMLGQHHHFIILILEKANMLRIDFLKILFAFM
jgi:GST-like protein